MNQVVRGFLFATSPYHSINHWESTHKLNKQSLQALWMGRCRRLSRSMAFIHIFFAYQSICICATLCVYVSYVQWPSKLGLRMNVIVHALHSIESNIEITWSAQCAWHIAAGGKSVHAIGSIFNVIFTWNAMPCHAIVQVKFAHIEKSVLLSTCYFLLFSFHHCVSVCCDCVL